MNHIRRYMKSWNKYTYLYGLNSCFIPKELREQCMDLFQQQNLLQQVMNGNSSMNLPCKYENSLNEIRFTSKFYETMESGFLTPASYLVRIVQEWNYLKSIGKPIKKPN